MQSVPKSIYNGVYPVKRRTKDGYAIYYRVRLRKDGRIVYEKLWKEEINAAKAWDYMVLQFFGETPEAVKVLNFPNERQTQLPDEPHARSSAFSPIAGVSYIDGRGWRGSTTVDGKRQYTGYFSSPYEAKMALDQIKSRSQVD